MKKKYFAKKGIAEYVIIDGDKAAKRRGDSYASDEKIYLYEVNSEREYEGSVSKGAGKMRCRRFVGIAANDMLSRDSSTEKRRETRKKQLKIYKDVIRRKDEELRLNNEAHGKKLRRKDEELHRKDEELRRKDEELRRKDEELRQKDEELRRKDQELRRKDEKQERQLRRKDEDSRLEKQKRKKEKEELIREIDGLRGKGKVKEN